MAKTATAVKSQETKASVTAWGVKDHNATSGPRVHEPVPGFRYSLTDGDFTPMPEHHARKFLCDKAFEVVDEAGDEVPPLGDAQRLRAGAQIPTLGLAQTIADYDELTMNALLARASQRAGGERFTSKSARSEIVGFLVGVEARVRDRREKAKVADQEIEEMSVDEAADILSGE